MHDRRLQDQNRSTGICRTGKGRKETVWNTVRRLKCINTINNYVLSMYIKTGKIFLNAAYTLNFAMHVMLLW